MTRTLIGNWPMRLVLTALLVGLGMNVASAADFPTRPVRIVVPFPAGSSTDVIARILAEKASTRLGQQVIVENRPGADGAVGGSEIKRASPDGYTLLLASNSAMSGVPATRTSPPYEVTADFTPITDIGRYNFFFFVNKDVPASSLAELVAHAKANPGKLNYGAGNITGRLSFATVVVRHGLELTYVPYRGEPPAMTDLITGRIQAMVTTPGTGAPHVRGGKIRALSNVLHKRSQVLPDVPTIAEAGLLDFNIEPWAGLFGPARMPTDVVATLNRAFVEAMGDPTVVQRMAELDFVLTPSTSSELAALVKRQLEAHRGIVAAAGIEIQ